MQNSYMRLWDERDDLRAENKALSDTKDQLVKETAQTRRDKQALQILSDALKRWPQKVTSASRSSTSSNRNKRPLTPGGDL